MTLYFNSDGVINYQGFRVEFSIAEGSPGEVDCYILAHLYNSDVFGIKSDEIPEGNTPAQVMDRGVNSKVFSTRADWLILVRILGPTRCYISTE